MARLTDYRLLTFDVYGTLIDWETGVLTALQPLLASDPAGAALKLPKSRLLEVFHECEAAQQSRTPDLKYADLLAAIHPQVAAKLGLPAPSETASAAFGASVASWPAFPDTVDALRRLGKRYKLVVLSNVDRESFAGTNAGPLEGVPFDLVLTAQDVGSYKPDLRNFEHMLREVKERFGVESSEVIQTAQSQFHDHHPARKVGIKSSWIVRPGAVMGNQAEEVWDWKFDTLGGMADAVDAEVKAGK
ncbi:haloacid dehalogenase [Sodiomyces alkalinus F11]|uniref:Haloacid dehalogenase n=1 Tax=Sodiomyces alkalinus (strain CBS 110278 / VKM F-3762 / F11) TaxID=1314773 RepID=A0A3N2PUL6_SODAK|nr:haloacid dehalogenase [Sodiomyces alkalinus F11]ROT38205.1 haloacid dehalogenase [Sodiomyces alkalinus F11]